MVNVTSGSAAGTLAIETDEALTTWDEYPTSQVLANTTTTESAVVALPSGSVLPGRTVGTTLAHLGGGNSVVAPQAEQPAGTLTGSPTTASSVTDAAGRYSVKINDPAAPVGQELNNELQGAANDPGTGFNINGATARRRCRACPRASTWTSTGCGPSPRPGWRSTTTSPPAAPPLMACVRPGPGRPLLSRWSAVSVRLSRSTPTTSSSRTST